MRFPLDHIVIYSADTASSARFYAALLGALGFEKRRDTVFARDGLFIDIRTALHESAPYVRGQRGVDHIGFKAPAREDVDSIASTLRDAGFTGRLITFDSGDYALFLADPDGVRIEVTCYANPDGDPVD
ncbi:MAG TPA: VOC family protein [Gammaproteobacteria bacterium]